MAKWRMAWVKCPSCKRTLREPVNMAQPPRLFFHSMHERLNEYAQYCHRCVIGPASPALQKAYDQTHARITAIAMQHEPKGGAP